MPTLAEKAVKRSKGLVVRASEDTTSTSPDSVAHQQRMKKLDTAIKSLIKKKKTQAQQDYENARMGYDGIE